MIPLDLCQSLYQNLLINYLKFTAKNVEIKTVNLILNFKYEFKGLKNNKIFYNCIDNTYDLICKYKGHIADAKFDNALSLIDKIKEGGISLANAKNDQIKI